MKRILIILLLFISCGGQYVFASPQTENQHNESIQTDIELMETILDKLLLKGRDRFTCFRGSSEGLYLEDYGLLFNVSYSVYNLAQKYDEYKFQLDTYEKTLQLFKKLGDGKKSVNFTTTEEESKLKDQYEKEISYIKDNLARFLGDYVSTLNYLNANYWVIVNVNFDGSSRWFSPITEEQPIRQLVAKAQMKDILGYRKGTINSDEFIQRRIQYLTKNNGDSPMEVEIGIFSDLMKSYLDRKNIHDEFNLSEGVKGFYIDGFGAIFTFTALMEPNIINIITESKGEENAYTFHTSFDEDQADTKEKVKLLEGKIITLLSRFGHTLKKLNTNEWVEIALNINAHRIDDEFSKIILKIKKNEIDNLSTQKINLDEFKKRIKVIKY